MKKFLPLIIIAVVAIGIYAWVKGINNTAVTLNENIKESWGNVETAYERRNSLIGNLVNTVKGAADFEKSTLEAVISARSKATQTTIDPSNITPEQLAAFSQAQPDPVADRDPLPQRRHVRDAADQPEGRHQAVRGPLGHHRGRMDRHA